MGKEENKWMHTIHSGMFWGGWWNRKTKVSYVFIAVVLSLNLNNALFTRGFSEFLLFAAK